MCRPVSALRVKNGAYSKKRNRRKNSARILLKSACAISHLFHTTMTPRACFCTREKIFSSSSNKRRARIQHQNRYISLL